MTKLYLFLAGLLLLSPGYAQTPHYIIKYGKGQEYEEEMEFRQGKTYKTEEYFKAGKRDSVYRQWDKRDSLITVGYYKNGKRQGEWRFLQTRIRYNYAYVTITYAQGKRSHYYYYLAYSPDPHFKSTKTYITYQGNYQNYTQKNINWYDKPNSQMHSKRISIIKNGRELREDFVLWDKRGQLRKQGQKLNDRYEGHWQWWHKNGQRKKEVWYRQGKKLRQKTYDKAGNLVEDKRF